MRAIDADKLKRKAQKCATEAWKMNLTARIETVLNQFIDWIDEAPTVEPERKKGEWIDDNCSECGFYVHHGDMRDFCPKCGAKMNGGNQNE